MTTDHKNDLSESWPSIFELASTIPQVDLARVARGGSGGKNRQPVTQGLIPEAFPDKEGYFVVTPEQLASLRVPKIEVNGEIRGFQREKVNAHVRKIARALLDGDEMPPLIISIFPDGQAYVDDGQHRALAAIVARKNLEVVVKKRSVAQARKLFTSQGKAKSLKTDDTLLTGDSALELFIQDALTDDTHPWSGLVAVKPSGGSTKMTPTTMGQMVGSFVFNALNQGASYYTTRNPAEFDEKLAKRMADLVKVFGTRASNPLAFRARSLRGIAYAAIHIFRRNPNSRPDDWDRWMRHMPTFDFAKYPHLLSKENELAAAMVEHWNKRLPQERRVKMNPYR